MAMLIKHIINATQNFLKKKIIGCLNNQGHYYYLIFCTPRKLNFKILGHKFAVGRLSSQT
jgi:hypothetical protein